jgi:hypothetical protein
MEPESKETADQVSAEEDKQTEVVAGNVDDINKSTTEE